MYDTFWKYDSLANPAYIAEIYGEKGEEVGVNEGRGECYPFYRLRCV